MSNIYKIDLSKEDLPEYVAKFPNREWIEAGIGILRNYGARELSVIALCNALEKEQDEFNGAFNGLESFLLSLLDYWYEKETLKYIDLMDQHERSAKDSMLAMIEIIHYADKQDEIAIRNWALNYPYAHKALGKVDRTRLDVGIGLFRELGFSEQESAIRSKILYTSSIGTEYTSISASLEQKIAMCELLMSVD